MQPPPALRSDRAAALVHRFDSASSSPSTVCRIAGDSSCILSAVFIAQESSCDSSPSMRALTPNKSFGEISSVWQVSSRSSPARSMSTERAPACRPLASSQSWDTSRCDRVAAILVFLYLLEGHPKGNCPDHFDSFAISRAASGSPNLFSYQSDDRGCASWRCLSCGGIRELASGRAITVVSETD